MVHCSMLKKCPYVHAPAVHAKNIQPRSTMEEQRRPHILSGRTLVRAGGLAPSRKTPSRAHPLLLPNEFIKENLHFTNIPRSYAARALNDPFKRARLLTRPATH